MYEPVGLYHGMPRDLKRKNFPAHCLKKSRSTFFPRPVHPLIWPTLPPGSERTVHVLPPSRATDDEGPSEEENDVSPPAPSPDVASSSSALQGLAPRVGQPTFTREQLAARAADMGLAPADLLRMLSSDQ